MSTKKTGHTGPDAGYYNDAGFVQRYLGMTEPEGGRPLVEALRRHLPTGATVLELGIGPGHDMNLLAEHYRVTGSDLSSAFLNRYRSLNPEADLLLLDARHLDTDRSWGAIYSNKVLQHLSLEELRDSLRRQSERLLKGGYLLHSFWAGEGEQFIEGLRCTYHSEDSLRELADTQFEVIQLDRYAEMEPDDSLLMLLRLRAG